MKPNRRQMLENCIVRGSLLAGATSLSNTQLLAFWEQGEAQASKPTATASKPTIHRRGDHPYGSREYLLCRPDDPSSAAAAATGTGTTRTTVQDKEGQTLQVLATLKANTNIIFGASSKLDNDGSGIPNLCRPLLAVALEDCQLSGQQPQAVAALYGLCEYVTLCANGEHATSVAWASLDDAAREAVVAIATGEPRPGHTVVGRRTHAEGAAGWEALAKEYLPLAYECELYQTSHFEFTGIELLADTQPSYLKSAGGAMARYFYTAEGEFIPFR